MGRAHRRCIDFNLAWKLTRYAAIVSLALSLCFCVNLKGAKTKKEIARSSFSSNCGKCHDSDAQGDGRLHSNFIPPPANLTLVRDARAMFLSIVSNGIPGTAMPQVPIDDSRVEAVMQYVAGRPPETSIEWEVPWELENKTPDTENGSALFITACVGCHGAAGDGTMMPPLWRWTPERASRPGRRAEALPG